MTKQVRNSLLLVLTAFIWGIAFVAQSQGGDAVGPYTFNCIRSFVGALVLMPAIHFLDRMGFSPKKPRNKEEKRRVWIAGISCGIPLFIASNLQQVGISMGTPVGKAGFLTACYILIVPLMGIFLKRRCHWNIWVAVAIALVGLYQLCLTGSLQLQLPDLLIILCAVMFSVQILVVDKYTGVCDGVRMAQIEFFVCGVLGVAATFFGDLQGSFAGMSSWVDSFSTWQAWIPILYAGVLSSGVAYTLQIVGQEDLNPTVASLLMSLESVFSVLAGAIILQQYLTGRELVGCIMIFAAIVLAQIPVTSIGKKKNV